MTMAGWLPIVVGIPVAATAVPLAIPFTFTIKFVAARAACCGSGNPVMSSRAFRGSRKEFRPEIDNVPNMICIFLLAPEKRSITIQLCQRNASHKRDIV